MRSRIPFAVGLAGLVWLLGSSAVANATRRGWLPPTALGKRSDGSFSPTRAVLLAPVLLPKWAKWWLRRWRERGAAAHVELRPGLIIGRRPRAHELPDTRTVIDLAADYPEPRGVRERVDYRSVPMLKEHGLSPQEAAFLARQIARRTGTVYLHCANGDKRTAVIAALALMAEGAARTPSAALQVVKRARPSVRPNDAQQRLLRAAARYVRQPR